MLSAVPAAAQAPPFDIAVCRYLPRHAPSADVEYKPGLDARGKRVAPADLPGLAGAVPVDRFEIPVTLDFARRLGFATPGAGALPRTAEVGRLTVQGNRMFFNGQPLNAASEAELVALCRTVR
ncbi:hypothetical protein [Azospirillum sp. TSO22-1]|uniref:hypothetical protein n=1 Tax=Azospirillum sp. TSO22-1 TaxID=716789 RepID=UPI000D647496|nr:hypothetical protein [Azospirillum sp. TSO22-1]